MKKGVKEMKKVLFPILALVLALALPMATPVLAAPPPFSATINITGDLEISVGETTTLTADWTTNEQNVTRYEWSVDAAGQGEEAIDASSGSSTFDFSTGTAGSYEITFRIWHHTQTDRDAFESVTVEVNQTIAIEVEKDYRYTNVCFEKDNDGDGEFNEDPVEEEIDNDGDGLFSEDPEDGADNDLDGETDEDPSEQIDNDGDGLFGEDDVDCPDGTYLGDFLSMDAEEVNYLLKAVVNKKDVVKSYNPGQYYAVSTVTVSRDVEMLTIEENFSDCTDIGTLNPVKGGGKVVIVQVGPGDEVAYQILDAKSPEVSISDDVATVILGPQEAGTTILMYVKFGPALKGEEWVEELTCENTTSAWVVADPDEEDIVSDNAMLELLLKE